MDLRTRILELIDEEWDRTRPFGGVGNVHSRDIYLRLMTEGWDVPDWKMQEILEELHAHWQIRGSRGLDPEARRIHGDRFILEPGE